MKYSTKSQILKDIYEDNLYRVVRGDREAEQLLRRPIKTYFSPVTLLAVFTTVVIFGMISLIRDGELSADSKPNKLNAQTINGNMAVSSGQSATNESLTLALADTAPSLFRPNIQWGSNDQTLAPPVDIRVKPDKFSDNRLFRRPEISMANLFGLDVKTIVIDPGHGGKDPGAVGTGSIYEKDIVLDLAVLLKDRLEQWGEYKVLLTRSKDESISLQSRVNFANEHKADLFISLHINAFPKASRNFVETYYFGATDDVAVAELAARENSESDYQYGEFKSMIQKIGDTFKFQESKQLAAYVQHSLYSNVKKLNKETSNHGIKPGPFVVLLGIDAPSILAEIANLTDKSEEKRLNSAEYQEKIANFLEKGIVNYLNSKTTLGERGNGEEKEELAQGW